MGDRQLNSFTLPSPDLALENVLVLPHSFTFEQTPLDQNCPAQERVTQTLSHLLIQHLRGPNAIVSLHWNAQRGDRLKCDSVYTLDY